MPSNTIAASSKSKPRSASVRARLPGSKVIRMGYCSYINPSTQASEDASEHYNYFRDYDPSLGRYLESDPVGLDGGLNTYGYVGGNPLIRLDATGEAWQAPVLFCLRYPRI